MLIHSGIVTHLIRVDEVPDPLFALSQMQEMPEVRFAAVFDDGLIALGCPDGLPDALDDIAVAARASAPMQDAPHKGLDRIEEVSARLAALVDGMEPEEVILSDQLGRTILDRLTSLEVQFARPASVDLIMKELTGRLGDLDNRLSVISTSGETLAGQVAGLERSITQFKPAGAELVAEKLEQLGTAQRTALSRVEAAMGKSVAGLEPALAHLSARAEETENRLSGWQGDLKALSQQLQGILDQTDSLPAALGALRKDYEVLASKPTPILDLTAQKESLSSFSSHLNDALSKMQTIARKSGENAAQTAARSDETIATLQTLPDLISATLRRDVDLTEITQAIAGLQGQLSALPDRLKLPSIAEAVTTHADKNHADQTTELETLRTGVQNILAQLDGLDRGVSQLHAKETDFEPLNEQFSALQNHATQNFQAAGGQLGHLSDALGKLAQHLGVPQLGSDLIAGGPLSPETSLNTLRMEFADLITKRMKEGAASLPDRSRRA
jgi:chromosome segregation ATPase